MTQPLMTGPALFSAILDAILDEPERWCQQVWHANTSPGVNHIRDAPTSEAWECGTYHCIAGWAQVLAFDNVSHFHSWQNARQGFLSYSHPDEVAAVLLGVYQATPMFDTRADADVVVDRAISAGLLDPDDPRIDKFLNLSPTTL